MKRFSFKYTPDGSKSTTTVPTEMFVDSSIVEKCTLTTKQKHYFDSDNYIKGWKISKKYADNINYFYIDFNDYGRGNYSGKVVFLNYNKPETCDNENSSYYFRCASLNWTVAIVVEETRLYSNCNDDYIYLMLPTSYFSKSLKGVFLSKEDMEKNKLKNKEKSSKKNEEIHKLLDNTNNGPIIMSTPKLEVVEINYSTKSIPNIKVGDIIYGTIDVLDEQGKNKLNVSSRYVNYIDVYVNDKLITTLPMSTFGNILSNNYKLKKIQ